MTNRPQTTDGGGSTPTTRDDRRPTRRGVLAALGGGVLATTALATPATSSHADPLVINDFEGEFPGSNALGEWSQTGDLEASVVSDDGSWLELSYDGTGWFASNVRRDVSAYDHLEIALRGADGGEEGDATIEVGGVEGPLDDLAEGSVGTDRSVLSIDLVAAGVDRSALDDVWLEFFDASGAVWIDELRFVASGPPAIGDAARPRDLDGDGTYEDIDGSGHLAFPDVNRFFQHSEESVVRDHADAFDFDDDGSVSLDDVLTLFERV
ncbi:hypothetical protein [Halococcoides cellulosivorans]|uniref:EF-hand domain-containing protein n=1 Tax=Halococcoides cellulosivorans TaxID=1679096 RepID=A0A2R4X0F6_9EURY|nr:hypothetical protein [Halococcoides cellulosivorans]AWB27251.1 hypothetical protein HARCEL1_05810 [Halococcoides cellulosivorans]